MHVLSFFPTVIFSETLPARLRVLGQPRLNDHMKRKGDYRSFYTILNRCSLWRDPVYIAWREAVGCYVEDVQEVMPVCVVEDILKRWPNPDGVPHRGHRRSQNQHSTTPLALPSLPISLMRRELTR